MSDFWHWAIDDSTAAMWSATAAWATVGIYVGLMIYARKQVDEAKTLRQEQARPFVIVDFEPNWLLQLVVQNIGRTAARDVRMQFSPPLDSSLSKPHPWEESSAFTEGIPLLPPHRQIKVDFDSSHSRFDEASTLPMRYDVTVSYRGHHKESKPFRDHYVLDLSIFRGTRLPEGGVPEIAKGIQDVKRAIDSAARRNVPAGWPNDFAGGTRSAKEPKNASARKSVSPAKASAKAAPDAAAPKAVRAPRKPVAPK